MIVNEMNEDGLFMKTHNAYQYRFFPLFAMFTTAVKAVGRALYPLYVSCGR